MSIVNKQIKLIPKLAQLKKPCLKKQGFKNYYLEKIIQQLLQNLLLFRGLCQNQF